MNYEVSMQPFWSSDTAYHGPLIFIRLQCHTPRRPFFFFSNDSVIYGLQIHNKTRLIDTQSSRLFSSECINETSESIHENLLPLSSNDTHCQVLYLTSVYINDQIVKKRGDFSDFDHGMAVVCQMFWYPQIFWDFPTQQGLQSVLFGLDQRFYRQLMHQTTCCEFTFIEGLSRLLFFMSE